MASARITSGFGVAPGFGAQSTKKPPKTGGIWGGSYQTGLGRAPTFTPQGGSGAAPSSPAPAVAPQAGLPVDPLYDQQIAGLDQTQGDTLAGLTRQRTAGLLGYGYNASYGGDGLVQGLTYDPNNPYSQAALARTVYQQSKTGTDNSMAARGQLYAGSRINAQNQNDTNFNVGENSRQNSLINFLNGLTGQETAAKNSRYTGGLQALGDRLGRAPTNPNYDPTPPVAPDATPAASTTADALKQFAAQQYSVQPGKNSKGQAGVWHTYSDGRPRVFVVGGTR